MKKIVGLPKAFLTEAIVVFLVNIYAKMKEWNIYDTSSQLKYFAILMCIFAFTSCRFEAVCLAKKCGHFSLKELESDFFVAIFATHIYSSIAVKDYNIFGLLVHGLDWSYIFTSIIMFSAYMLVMLVLCSFLSVECSIRMFHAGTKGITGKRLSRGWPVLIFEAIIIFIFNHVAKYTTAYVYDTLDYVLYIAILGFIFYLASILMEKCICREPGIPFSGRDVKSNVIVGLVTTVFYSFVSLANYNVFGILLSDNDNAFETIWRGIVYALILYVASCCLYIDISSIPKEEETALEECEA